MSRNHPARSVVAWRSCSTGDVSGNVSMTCRHYGISQPVYSTRLRRYGERASTTIAVMPIRPSDSHAIKTHFRLAQSSRSVIVRLGRSARAKHRRDLASCRTSRNGQGRRHDQLGLRAQDYHQRLTQRLGLRLVDHRLTAPLPERRIRADAAVCHRWVFGARDVLRHHIRQDGTVGSLAVRMGECSCQPSGEPSVSDSASLVASTAWTISWVAASGCDTKET